MSVQHVQLQPGSSAERKVIAWSVVLAAVLLLADQWSKAAVVCCFEKFESVPLIRNFFSLTYVTNRGAAWSMLEGQIWLLLLIAAAVTAGSLWFMRRLTEGYIERYIALFMVLSGVFGNSIDRIWRGAVVDFFDVFVVYGGKAYHWPVFNVADCAICVGVGIFLISSLCRPSNDKNKEEEEK